MSVAPKSVKSWWVTLERTPPQDPVIPVNPAYLCSLIFLSASLRPQCACYV